LARAPLLAPSPLPPPRRPPPLPLWAAVAAAVALGGPRLPRDRCVADISLLVALWYRHRCRGDSPAPAAARALWYSVWCLQGGRVRVQCAPAPHHGAWYAI